MRGLGIGLASAAMRPYYFAHAKPGMIIQQLNEALSYRASCAENRYIKFPHFPLLLYMPTVPDRTAGYEPNILTNDVNCNS